MRNIVKYISFSFAVGLILLYFHLYLSQLEDDIQDDNYTPQYHIQVMGRAVDYFDSLFAQGAQVAAEQNNAYVEFVSESFSDAHISQYVSTAIRGKVDAVVFQSSDSSVQSDMIQLADDYSVELLIYESDINAVDLPVQMLRSDSYSVGLHAMNLALQAMEDECKVVLLIDSTDAINSTVMSNQAIEGIEDAITQSGRAELVNCLLFDGSPASASEAAQALRDYKEEYNTVICLHETYTSFITRTLEEMGKSESVCIIGYGAQPNVLNFIEQGIIYGSVCPDGYAIGYDAISLLCNKMSGEEFEDTTDENLFIITRNNLDEVRARIDGSDSQ